MKTNVADTSVGAYHQLRHKDTQTKRIYEYVENHGSATISMIANKLGMEKSTTSARVNAMVNGITRNGRVIQQPSLEMSFKGKCPITGVRVIFWQVIPSQTALEWDDLS